MNSKEFLHFRKKLKKTQSEMAQLLVTSVKKCPPEHRKKRPAWEFQAGHLCWFICGTIREGTIQRDWDKKMKMCRDCEVLQPLLIPKEGIDCEKVAPH